jgi:hypothetical protein
MFSLRRSGYEKSVFGKTNYYIFSVELIYTEEGDMGLLPDVDNNLPDYVVTYL